MGDTPICFPIVALLSDGTGDDPAAVARAHEGAKGLNTLDWEYPQGGRLVMNEAVDPDDAKREGGAGWAAGSTQEGSGAADAAHGCEPGSVGAAKSGANPESGTSGGSCAAATGAAVSALW